MTVLAKENHSLHKEREEYVHFLNDARTSVDTYLSSAQQQPQAQSAANSGGLLGELQKDIENRLESEKKKQPAGQQNSGLKDVEEFFFWAVSTIKISLAIKYPHRVDKACQVTPRQLWNEATEAKLEFHEWYQWLLERLTKELTPARVPKSYRATPLPSSSTSTTTSSSKNSKKRVQKASKISTGDLIKW
mmetsp:Transcript_4455/g.6687  ORF Transcript_4455/g.6687 Transcript_4455/m.6687 type:complete len:190 (-) Transcript_4455:17-586(-)